MQFYFVFIIIELNKFEYQDRSLMLLWEINWVFEITRNCLIFSLKMFFNSPIFSGIQSQVRPEQECIRVVQQMSHAGRWNSPGFGSDTVIGWDLKNLLTADWLTPPFFGLQKK